MVRRKRQVKELVNILGDWAEQYADDDEEDSIDDAMEDLAKLVDTWKKRHPQKTEVGKSLQGILDKLKGTHAGRDEELQKVQQKETEKKRELQKFYPEFLRNRLIQKDEKAEGKGSKGSKGKGLGLPRFDLQKICPRREVCAWQTAKIEMEEGKEPRGAVTVCQNTLQMLEFQALAKEHKLKKKLAMICKQVGGEVSVRGGIEILLPWVGNLALVRAVISCSTGETPEITGENPMQLKDEEIPVEVEKESLRVIIPFHFLEADKKKALCEEPFKCLSLVDCKLPEVRTNGWSVQSGCIQGYVQIPKSEADTMLGLSGRAGIFFVRLACNMQGHDPATWISQNVTETDLNYLKRVQELAKEKGTSLCFRRGRRSGAWSKSSG